MAHVSPLIASDIELYLHRQGSNGLLRFITCGSVDDGKSTLIGRLLHESKMIFEDQLAALVADSRISGTRGGEIDYALLLDGLSAERQQGITIDVAYRYFSTDRRNFIVADTPGHEQYTRNMVTGASTADLAIILIDARKGVLQQTRRHAYLLSLLGVQHVVLAVNKMDLVDYSQEVFGSAVDAFEKFASSIGLRNITAIPVSAVVGDNITSRSERTAWYQGPSLMGHLEEVRIAGDVESQPFRMPVQWVSRPHADFRGFAGTIVSGTARPGDRVLAVPSGRESTIARIVTTQGDLPIAIANQSVMITLEDELDLSRGDVLSATDVPVGTANQFEATIVWLADSPLLPGRSYQMKLGTKWANAIVSPLKHRIDVNTLRTEPAKTLALNEIGVCQLELDQPLAFEPYATNRDLGGFILVDRMNQGTVGAGMLSFALRRSQNVHWQAVDVSRQARALIKAQTPCVLWFTGLSGAGKSTIANLVEKRLHSMGRHTYLLDGDNVRHGLNRDLGFTEAARVENIRRVSEVAALMVDAGLIVLVAFISPFRCERDTARALIPPGAFLEIFVDTPMEIAEARDTKGLYKKARRGELKNFTGIDSPYERPESAEIVVDGGRGQPDEAAERVIQLLVARGLL